MANGSSSTPGGNLFPASAAAPAGEVGNNQQQSNANATPNDDNDNIDDLVSRLTSGTVIGNDDNVDGNGEPNGNNSSKPNNNDGNNDGDPASPVIENLMKVYKGDSITEGIDVNDIAEKLGNGDLSGIMDALGATANKAVERSLNSVLSLIPEIISQTEQRVLKQVGELNTNDRVWDAFLAEHPDYSAHKGTVRDHLQKAIDGGATEEQAFAAVDMIFGNLKKKKPASQVDAFSPDSGSEAFDLSQYGM